MPSRSTPPDPIFSPLKLLKVDVRQDHNGVSVVMEFIDNNGTKLITPSMPYPDNFDPMKVEHAEYRGDEIRIKNEAGDLLTSVYADSIHYENPIETQLDPNGYMCMLPEEGEEDIPVRRFSLDQAQPSEVGFTRAFEQANRARQQLDEADQAELNRRFPDQARPVIGASAWFRENHQQQMEQAGFDFDGSLVTGNWQYPATQANAIEEHPKIKIDFDMKCTCCEGKIHYPDKLIQLLGEEGTIKYFKFCKKTKSEPQLFCCSCFALMSNNSNIISAVNKMNVKIKKMVDLDDKEAVLEKREKELDDQLKAIKK